MIAGDPNVQNVELVAAALGDLCDELVLVGGCAASLLIDAPICRWRIGEIEVDLMPTDETVLGFFNRWYPEAAASATRLNLPSGTTINLITAPAFLATKFDAFRTRGKADFLLSHDFEDIINVVEGRLSIVEEVGAGATALRTYLASQFAEIIITPSFMNVLPGLVAYDELHSQRVTAVTNRISAIAALASP